MMDIKSPMPRLGQRRHLLAALWFFWAVTLLGVYHTRLWRLLARDLSVWEALVHDGLLSRGWMALWGAGLAFLVLQVLGWDSIWQTPGWRTDGRHKRLLYQSGMGLSILTFLMIVSYLLHRYLFAASSLLGSLPALGEALSRAWRGLFGAGLVLLAAQVMGAAICWLLGWHPDDWREGVLYHTAAGLGAVAYLSLGLATLGFYRPLSVQVLIAVVLSGGGLWIAWRVMRSGPDRWKLEALANPAADVANRGEDKVWKAIALLAVLIAFMGALAPEIEYDALWYHLWLPKLWLAQGQPMDLIAEYVSLYPMTWELIFGAGLVLGGPVAAKLLHFACLPLTGLLTYQLTKRFMPQASPWLAVALFFTVPIVLWEATTAYIDLALALHVGLAVYALLRYVEGRRWQWLGLAALNLGLALATKHLALFVLPLATGGLALQLWLEERNLRRALVPALLLGGLSLLLPLPWYLRSWLASGDPVFPNLFGIFGASPPERWNGITEQGLARFEARFGRPRTALNLLALPWDMTVHAARYGGTLGPMFLLLVPGLALRRHRAQATPWLVSWVLLYVAFWALPVSSFQMRFLVPITPLLAVLAAAACVWPELSSPGRLSKWSRLVLHGGVAALLLLNLPPFTSLHEGDRMGWDGWLTHLIRRIPIPVVIGRESQQDYLARSVPSYAAWHYIDKHLPADARVLTFSGGDHFYSERERIWSDAPVAHPAVWGAPRGQEEQAFEILNRLDILYILFDKQQLSSLEPGTLAIAQPSVLASWCDLVYEDDRFALYRIRWEQVVPQSQGKGSL